MRGGQTIAKGLDLLRSIGASPEGSTFTELQLVADQPKATLHRLLQTLVEQRFVRFSEDDRRYRLGHDLLELAGKAWARTPLRDLVRGALTELALKTGEGAVLAVRDGADVIWTDRVEGIHPADGTMLVGARGPAFCLAPGKILLAYMADGERRVLMEQLVFHKLTPETPASPAALLMQLQSIRRAGFSIESEEHTPGRASIAAPIFDSTGRVAAALAVLVPLHRSDRSRLAEIARLTAAAATSATLSSGGRIAGAIRPIRLAPVTPEMDEPSWLPQGDVPC